MRERDQLLEPMLTVDWSGQSMLATGSAPVPGIEMSGILGRLLGSLRDPSVSLRDESAFLVSGLEELLPPVWSGEDPAYWDFAAFSPDTVTLRLKSLQDQTEAWTPSVRASRYRGSTPSQQPSQRPSTARKPVGGRSVVTGPGSIPGLPDIPPGRAAKPLAPPEVQGQARDIAGSAPGEHPIPGAAKRDAVHADPRTSTLLAPVPPVVRPVARTPRGVPVGRGSLLVAERPIWTTPDAPRVETMDEPGGSPAIKPGSATSAARPGSTTLSQAMARQRESSPGTAGPARVPGRYMPPVGQSGWPGQPGRPGPQAMRSSQPGHPGPQTLGSSRTDNPWARASSLADALVAAMGPALGRVATVAGWFDSIHGTTPTGSSTFGASGDSTLSLLEFPAGASTMAEPGTAASPRPGARGVPGGSRPSGKKTQPGGPPDAPQVSGSGTGKEPSPMVPIATRTSATRGSAAGSAAGSLPRVYPEAAARPDRLSPPKGSSPPGASPGAQPTQWATGTGDIPPGNIRPRRPSAAGSLTQSVAVQALQVGRASGSVPGTPGQARQGRTGTEQAIAMSGLPETFQGLGIAATGATPWAAEPSGSSMAAFLPGVASEPSLLLLSAGRSGQIHQDGITHERSGQQPAGPGSGLQHPPTPVSHTDGASGKRFQTPASPASPAPAAWSLRAEDLLAPLGSSIHALLGGTLLASIPGARTRGHSQASDGPRYPLESTSYEPDYPDGTYVEGARHLLRHRARLQASMDSSIPGAATARPQGAPARPEHHGMRVVPSDFVPLSMAGPHLDAPQRSHPVAGYSQELGFVAPSLARILASLSAREGAANWGGAVIGSQEEGTEQTLVTPGERRSSMNLATSTARRPGTAKGFYPGAIRESAGGSAPLDRAPIRPGRGTRHDALPGIPEAPSTVSLAFPAPGSRSPESLWGTAPMVSVQGAGSTLPSASALQPGGSFPLVTPALAAVSATASMSRRQDAPPAASPEGPEAGSRPGSSAAGPTIDLDALAEEMASRILRRIKRDKERRGING